MKILSPSQQLIESLTEPAKKKSRKRSEVRFYGKWIDRQLLKLSGIKETLRIIITNLQCETPVEPPDEAQRPSNDYEPWYDYFSGLEKVIDHFFDTGDIILPPAKKPIFLYAIVNDQKAFHKLQRFTEMLLTLVSYGCLANDRGAFANFVDDCTDQLKDILNFIIGWRRPSKTIMEMLPDFELGVRRRDQIREWSSGRRYHGTIDERDKNIRHCADKIRVQKPQISKLQLAIKLSSPPYNFLSVKGTPLSERQIRKIIS